MGKYKKKVQLVKIVIFANLLSISIRSERSEVALFWWRKNVFVSWTCQLGNWGRCVCVCVKGDAPWVLDGLTCFVSGGRVSQGQFAVGLELGLGHGDRARVGHRGHGGRGHHQSGHGQHRDGGGGGRPRRQTRRRHVWQQARWHSPASRLQTTNYQRRAAFNRRVHCAWAATANKSTADERTTTVHWSVRHGAWHNSETFRQPSRGSRTIDVVAARTPALGRPETHGKARAKTNCGGWKRNEHPREQCALAASRHTSRPPACHPNENN